MWILLWPNREMVLKAWTKAFLSCDPAVAEAVAVLWEVQIAKSEMFNSIIMERDANACFDTLNGKLDDGN
jgi:hypothetical protein